VSGVLCLAPDRNAENSSKVVTGCSNWSAYFVGQVSGMAPCSMVTHNGEVNISHENTAMVIWIYDGV